MIRIGVLSALAGFGLAAVFVSPTLTGSPGGEPMVVAGPDASLVQPANFRRSGCALVPAIARDAIDDAGNREHLAVSVAFLSGMEDNVLIIFDAGGRIVATGAADWLERLDSKNPLALPCFDTESSAAPI